jgi:hypothetical protein
MGKMMKSVVLPVALSAIFTGNSVLNAEVTGKEKTQPAKILRIGTFDSRSIAVGFIGSEVYKSTAGKVLLEKVAAYKKAKASGDKEMMKKLNAWGVDQQYLLHQQAFSTAPVDNILKHIADKLPKIKKQANLDLLVSKWDKQTLDKYKSAVKVDVTLQLLDSFKPNAKQKKSALEIRKHEPLPLSKIKRNMD